MELGPLLPIITALIAAGSSVATAIKFFLNSTKKAELDNRPISYIETNDSENNLHPQLSGDVLHIDGDINHIIKNEIKQLNDYYHMNKTQAAYSFNASISAIILGLVTIGTGIWLLYFQQPSNLPFASITGISGVLAQFIGASYFVMYRTSLKQVNYFFNQLVVMQDTMLTIELARSLPNGGKPSEKKQIELIEKVVVAVLERSSNLERGSLSLAYEDTTVKQNITSKNTSHNHNQSTRKISQFKQKPNTSNGHNPKQSNMHNTVDIHNSDS